MAVTLEIKKGDLVEIQVGGIENKGKRGKILAASPKHNKVVIENLNMVKKNTKPRSAQKAGGIIEKPRAIDASNVMLVCPSCGKATRVAHVLGEKGKFVRQCKKCGAVIDKKVDKEAKAAAKIKKAAAKKAASAE